MNTTGAGVSGESRSAPVIQEGRIGAIPVFYCEGPEPAYASLQFRVGQADEPLSHRGITHLIEHLAFFGAGKTEHMSNGFVSLGRTNFYASGTQDEVERFLGGITRSLSNLPFDRLDREKQVLESEASSAHHGNWVHELMMHRFGARSFGVLAWKELGLSWLDAETIDAWRKHWFCADNAAIWIHGPRPPRLAIDLPRGSRAQSPDVRALGRAAFPAFCAENSGGVGIAMLGPCGWDAMFGMWVAQERLTDRLRMRDGVTYEVLFDYDRLNRDTGHYALGAACHEEHGQHVLDELMAVMEDLATRGPSAEELALQHRLARKGLDEDLFDPRAVLDKAVLRTLISDEPRSVVAELEAVTSETVSRAIASSLQTALVSAPLSTRNPRVYLSNFERRPAASIAGRSFETRSHVERGQLVIGPAGICVSGGGEQLCVPAEELAAVIRESDGAYRIVGMDGGFFIVDPDRFSDSAQIVDEIHSLARGVIIPSDDPGPGLIKRLADAKLARPWVVTGALDAIVNRLRGKERPLTMAEANRHAKTGVLALTDQRLLYAQHTALNQEFLSFEIRDIANLEKRGRVNPRIELSISTEKLIFSSVNRERADEIVAGFQLKRLELVR